MKEDLRDLLKFAYVYAECSLLSDETRNYWKKVVRMTEIRLMIGGAKLD